MTKEEAQRRATKGIAKGLLKTISKMGISTIPSYCGAQVFEAIGLSRELVDRHFTGTASRIGGIGIEELASDTLDRHARAWPGTQDGLLPVTGLYAWRREGEHHQWNPDTIARAPARGAERRLRVLRGVRASSSTPTRRGARRFAA